MIIKIIKVELTYLWKTFELLSKLTKKIVLTEKIYSKVLKKISK